MTGIIKNRIQNAANSSKSEVSGGWRKNSSENGAIDYDCVEFEDFLEKISLINIQLVFSIKQPDTFAK